MVDCETDNWSWDGWWQIIENEMVDCERNEMVDYDISLSCWMKWREEAIITLHEMRWDGKLWDSKMGSCERKLFFYLKKNHLTIHLLSPLSHLRLTEEFVMRDDKMRWLLVDDDKQIFLIIFLISSSTISLWIVSWDGWWWWWLWERWSSSSSCCFVVDISSFLKWDGRLWDDDWS